MKKAISLSPKAANIISQTVIAPVTGASVAAIVSLPTTAADDPRDHIGKGLLLGLFSFMGGALAAAHGADRIGEAVMTGALIGTGINVVKAARGR